MAGEMSAAGTATFYPGFRTLDVEAAGVRFAGEVGGSGPPVLLLHGYPQTHVAWRKIAPALAGSHNVVIPDLPGYGASRPRAMQPRWTKRRAAKALLSLMRACGHRRFAVVELDRGARVGYRLALDHPEAVAAYMSLTVVPTLDAMAAVDTRFVAKNFHWFLRPGGGPARAPLLGRAGRFHASRRRTSPPNGTGDGPNW